jgi:transketolase
MMSYYADRGQFKKLFANNELDLHSKQKIACSMLRVNILSAIQHAGSGHLGTSLSVLEVMLTSLMFLEKFPKKSTHFFSSKGHDVPALYACYEALGNIENGSLKTLRKFGGLPGHPDVETPNILFNTGSLGMGISKANGWLSSKELNKEEAKLIVVIGDGEFQEGQNFEALMFLQNNPDLKPLIIMDSNQIQSDTWTHEVKSFEPLRGKVLAFGLNYEEVDGHDINALNDVIERHFSDESNGATFVRANTVKGKGLSFAEEGKFRKNLELYEFHSGALEEKLFLNATTQLINNVLDLSKNNVKVEFSNFLQKDRNDKVDQKKNNLLNIYKESVGKFFEAKEKNIALNADLVKDAGSLEIKRRRPNQFFEFGIAEQDMVSFASGLAAGGFTPWCHSFACFLTTRAQEQIFNFCSERRKGLFIGALAGPIPSAPGHSHQMIRDVGIMSNMPFLYVVEPLTEVMVSDFIEQQEGIKEPIYLRLTNADLLLGQFNSLSLPPIGDLIEIIPSGSNTTKVLIVQGAILFSELVSVIDEIRAMGNVAVYGAVWLNRISDLSLEAYENKDVIIFEASTYSGDFASFLSVRLLENNIKTKTFKRMAINHLPECGESDLVLKHHALSGGDMLKSVL